MSLKPLDARVICPSSISNHIPISSSGGVGEIVEALESINSRRAASSSEQNLKYAPETGDVPIFSLSSISQLIVDLS